MAVPLSREVTILYGPNGRKAGQLHDLFYHLPIKQLVLRDEVREESVQQYCAQCSQALSVEERAKGEGRCGYCCSCPLCSAVLLSREDDDGCYLVCSSCRWRSDFAKPAFKVKGGLEQLGSELLRAENSRPINEAMEALRRQLKELGKDPAVPDIDPYQSSRVLVSSVRALGGLGMSTEAQVAKFEKSLVEHRQAVWSATLPVHEGGISLEEAAAEPTFALKEGPVDFESSFSFSQWMASPHLECAPSRHALPRRNHLSLTSQLRGTDRRLLVGPVEKRKRLPNHSAVVLLPRMLVLSPIPAQVEGSQVLPLQVALVNYADTPCSIRSLVPVASHLCTCEIPDLGEGIQLTERPERDSTRVLSTALPEGRALDSWENCCVMIVSLTVADGLPAKWSPREGVGVTLCMELDHQVAEDKLTTPVYIFLNIPFATPKQCDTPS